MKRFGTDITGGGGGDQEKQINMNSEYDSQKKECKRITKSGFDFTYELGKPGDVREGTDEAKDET